MPSGSENKNNNQTLVTGLENSGLGFKETELDLKVIGKDAVHTASINTNIITGNNDELPDAHKCNCTHHLHAADICQIFSSYIPIKRYGRTS